MENLSISGRIYRPHSSRQEEAKLVTRNTFQGKKNHTKEILVDAVDSHGLVITSASLDLLSIAPPLGSTPRRVTFPDKTLFETNDHKGVSRLTGTTYSERLHRAEQFHPRLISITVMTLGLVFFLWRYGLDLIVSVAIELTPPLVIQQLDRGTLSSIDLLAKPTEINKDKRIKIQKIFLDLTRTLKDETKDYNFTLTFRKIPLFGPNAFALPGGTVIMTDQFVEKFPEKDILAGVLGHELGHVVEKHSLHQLYRSLGFFFLISLLAGDVGPILEDILLEGRTVLSLAYSRKHEKKADQFGLKLAHRAGYDPKGLKLFFERLSEIINDESQWLSTHPSNKKRIKAIDRFINGLE